MPKISIITPIYRTEEYLDKCLHHLVAQTLQDIEFIWVDNGANDKCRNIIAQYKNARPNIKVIHLAKNIGYSGAMNKGLEVATGEYIGFCDSDDYADADFFEKLYRTATVNNADIAFAKYKLTNDDKEVISEHLTTKTLCSTLQDKFDALKNGAVWDKIFKKEMLDAHQINFPKNEKSYFDDNIFLIQAVKFANKIALLDDGYYHYVQRENSTLHQRNNKDDQPDATFEVIKFIFDFAIQNKFDEEEQNAVFKFVERSLPLKKVLKDNKKYTALLERFHENKILCSLLSARHREIHPTVFQRIFYINKNEQKVTVRLLGFKITHKKGSK